jgi:hypothetical protein
LLQIHSRREERPIKIDRNIRNIIQGLRLVDPGKRDIGYIDTQEVAKGLPALLDGEDQELVCGYGIFDALVVVIESCNCAGLNKMTVSSR